MCWFSSPTVCGHLKSVTCQFECFLSSVRSSRNAQYTFAKFVTPQGNLFHLKVLFHVQGKMFGCFSHLLASMCHICLRFHGFSPLLNFPFCWQGKLPFQNMGIDLSHNCLLVNSERLEPDIWFWFTHPREVVGPSVLESWNGVWMEWK